MGADRSGRRAEEAGGLSTETTQFSQFRGRRTARPLRGSRSAALEHGLPKHRIELDDLGAPFAGGRPVWLEIGFGSGEHLLAQAARHPDTGFIGCEPFMNGVSALLKGLEETGLTNVSVFTDDARFLLKVLPDRSIARCFVLFADPWPKKRHNKRRIVNPETLDDLARVLAADGEIYLATDDTGLAEWYEEVVTAHSAFTLQPAGEVIQKRPGDWPGTRYEEKALEKGRLPFYYKVIRRP